jgi:hypothetical protein
MILYTLWLVVVLSGPLTVILNTSISTILSNKLLLLSVIQRMTGLVAYCLLFTQILLGSFMGKWIQIAGSKAYRAHVVQGLLAYGFVFIHPFFQTLIDFQLTGKLTPTLLPSYENTTEIYLNFGRSALLLITVGVIAGYFRTRPFFRRNWKIFHILNYFAFYSIFIHARFIGSDVFSQPFVSVFYLSFAFVTLAVIYRLAVWFKEKYSFYKLEQKSMNDGA